MSREIKFRGIDAVSNEIVYGDLIHGVGYKEGSLYILPRVKNLASVKNCDPLDGVKIIDGTQAQFTGLKDNNGVDIYEGDIIRYITNYYGKLKEDNIQEIKWIDDMEHDGFGCPLATGFLLRGYDWQVIGNIYENPELLK